MKKSPDDRFSKVMQTFQVLPCTPGLFQFLETVLFDFNPADNKKQSRLFVLKEGTNAGFD
jgi:hypothetical protein